jgi:hypothetical protein
MHAETGAMPADDRFGLDDHQQVFQGARSAAKRSRTAAQRAERQPGPSSLQDRDLLAYREDLKGGIGAAPEVDPQGGEDCEHERDHGLTVVIRRNVHLRWQKCCRFFRHRHTVPRPTPV